MVEREAVVGLLVAAALAWVLPAVAEHFTVHPREAASVITGRLGPSAADPPRFTWSPAPPASLAGDGWVVDADGSRLYPIPGWRGLLFGHPLDLNTATAEDLEALPGIGPQLASRVLAERAAAGPFGAVEELQRVRGIGPKTLARLRPLVTVGSPNPAR